MRPHSPGARVQPAGAGGGSGLGGGGGEGKLYDAHAHLFDFYQHSEGIGSLVDAMNAAGVGKAAVMGCSMKKNWSEFEERRAPDAFNDTDILYYFSLTDQYLTDAVQSLPPADMLRFFSCLSGFSPVDKSSPEQIAMMLDRPGKNTRDFLLVPSSPGTPAQFQRTHRIFFQGTHREKCGCAFQGWQRAPSADGRASAACTSGRPRSPT